MQSERMKTELITNVSHDIKTSRQTSSVHYGKPAAARWPFLAGRAGSTSRCSCVRNSTRLKKLTEDSKASKAATRQSDGPSGGS